MLNAQYILIDTHYIKITQRRVYITLRLMHSIDLFIFELKHVFSAFCIMSDGDQAV